MDNALTQFTTGTLTAIVGPTAERDLMHEAAVQFALRGPLQIIDGGNRFDVYTVARQMRRHTVDLDTTLSRISYARAFTCYQMVTLLQETPLTAGPLLILDLLTTFYDESVALNESYRLLRQVIAEIERLRRPAPVVISLRAPTVPAREGLLRQLLKATDQQIMRLERKTYRQTTFF
ncbi:MAG: hypothetical protein QNJ45_01535 [Ardenticatenaceae bacterium]|nr:hypothetical protein [Ardenticatenaceae bacterium]